MNIQSIEDYQKVMCIVHYKDTNKAVFETEKVKPIFEFTTLLQNKYGISKKASFIALDSFVEVQKEAMNEKMESLRKDFEPKIRKRIEAWHEAVEEADGDTSEVTDPKFSDIEDEMNFLMKDFMAKKIEAFAEYHGYEYPDLLASSYAVTAEGGVSIEGVRL